MNAHLVLDLAHRDVVALAQRAIRVHQIFRHDEERDALRPLAAAGGLGEHEVDDVLGHVVIAGRDEDLLAGDEIGAILLRLGPGAHHAEIRARMGLGQVHGAGPVAADHLRQPGALLLLGAMGMDRRIGAVGQALIHVEGHVGRDEDLAHRRLHHIGQALTAIGRIAVERGPAAFLELGEGLGEALGRAHHAILQPAALHVAHAVERRQNVAGELARLFQHGGGEVGLQLVIARDPRAGDLQHLVQDELHVGHGRVVDRHSFPLCRLFGRSAAEGGQRLLAPGQLVLQLRDRLIEPRRAAAPSARAAAGPPDRCAPVAAPGCRRGRRGREAGGSPRG